MEGGGRQEPAQPAQAAPATRLYTYHDWQTYVGLAIFLYVWLLIFKSRWECLPIGRPTSAMMGAALMVMVGILSEGEAYACIDAGTLMLLLGLMMILGILEGKGVVNVLMEVLMYGTVTPLGLLARISLLAGFMSAFIMNDGAALILSLVVVKICDKFALPVTPYMMAMATSANIGSAATPLGNPKNMVVHSKANISFISFVMQMGPPALVGLLFNTGLIYWYFSKELATATIGKASNDSSVAESEDSDGEVDNDQFTKRVNKDLLMLQRARSLRNLQAVKNEKTSLLEKVPNPSKPSDNSWVTQLSQMQYKTFESIVQQDPDAKLLYDQVRMVHLEHEVKGPVDPGPAMNLAQKFRYPVQLDLLVEQVKEKEDVVFVESKRDSHSVQTVHSIHTDIKPKKTAWETIQPILMAATLFLMYVGFVMNFPMGWTTMTAAIVLVVLERSANGVYDIDWQILIYIIVAPLVLSSHPVVSVGGFCLLVIVLSFIFTSIPTVLLVSPHLESLTGPMQSHSWLLLAWSVTLCGNLTIFGSVAGVIASQKAEAAGESIPFMTWFNFAFPSTLVVLAIGAAILVVV